MHIELAVRSLPLLRLRQLRLPTLLLALALPIAGQSPGLVADLPLADDPAVREIRLSIASISGARGSATVLIQGQTTKEAWQVDFPWQGPVSFNPPARLQIESSAFWAADLDLDATATEANLQLWPVAELRGSLSPDSAIPSRLQLSFLPARTEPSAKPQANPAGKVECPLEGRNFHCVLPAFPGLDLKLEAAGMVPTYLWDRQLQPGATERMSAIKLEKGASIAGWVMIPKEIAPAEIDVVLSVATSGFHGDPVLGTQLDRKSRKTGIDPRGFFQLTGLEPGSWQLRARSEGRPDGPPALVLVRRDEETILPSSLELPEPGRLQVHLEPGASPWTFSVLSRAEESHVSQLVQSSSPDETGWLMLEGLPIGDFDYQVTDSKNGIWTSGSFSIVPGPNPPLVIEIPQIPVKGIVSIGDQGVASLITFGAMGDRQIPIASGEDGHFSGFLPRSGRWEIAAELADAGYIRLPPVEVPAKGGELKIRIPAASISGQVFESGAPKKDAVVIVKEADSSSARIHGSAVTDGEGRFRIKGLAGGKREILAKSRDRQSEVLDLTIEDAEKVDNLRLDLLESRILRGRILADSSPLPAASIEAVPEPRRLGRAHATTDIEGRFELRLPAGTVGASLVVLARGYGAAIGRVSSFDGEFNLALQSSFGDLVLNGIECRPQTHLLSYDGAHLDLFDFFAILSTIDQATNGPDSLRLNGLAPGPYLICEQGTGKCLDTYVTAGNTTTSSWSRQDRNPEGAQ